MNTPGVDCVTVIKSTSPPVLCKRYTKREGKVHKDAVAHVTEGTCRTWPVPDAQSMVKLLGRVTQSKELCIVPGVWHGADGTALFDLVTEGELSSLAGADGQVQGGIHLIGERHVAARLKRGIQPSSWLLIDADNPPGIPDEWASMNLAERLVFMDKLIPGISTCERIELRGSSARVVNGSGAGQRTHAWIRVTHPDLIETMKARVGVDMVNAGMAFRSPRFSRKEPGKVIGHEQRTVIDLSVWTTGRIVFNAQPELGAGMHEYTVADADIIVVNEGAGELSLAKEVMPRAASLLAYKGRTGVELSVKTEDGQPRIVSTGQLAMDTEIESKGLTKTLADWIKGMRPGDKLRCEAPFRASQSEAAMIRICEDGRPIVYDVGNGTTYRLAEPAGGWPEPTPLPDELPSVQPFDPELLPLALRGWIMDISHRMQCPPDYSAVAAVAAVSSLIGARAVVRPKAYDDWAVVPNLWALAIGRPGVMKSPAISEVLKPLHRLQADERQRWEGTHADWELDQKVAELDREDREKRAKKAVGTDKAKARALLLPDDSGEPEPIKREFIVNDATVEAFQEVLAVNPFGTLAYRDEIYGLLTGLDRQGQEGSRAFYLTGYDGDKGHTTLRIIRGETYIKRVCIAMLGGIQPSRLQSYVRGAVEGGAADDGLLQRFSLAVWPDVAPEFTYVDRWPDTAPRQRANAVFDRLAMLQPEADDEPQVWRFSPQAQEVFIEWYTASRQELKRGELHPAIESHLSKYAKLIPALALIFALIDTPDSSKVIHLHELLRALAWGQYLRSHAERLYSAATKPETSGAVALLNKILAGKFTDGDGVMLERFTPRQIAVKHWAGLTSPEDVRKAADLLVDFDWLRHEVTPPGAAGGRPSECYVINPAAPRRSGGSS